MNMMVVNICLKLILMCTMICMTECFTCPGNFKSVTFNQTFDNRWGEIAISNNEIAASLRNNTGSSGFTSRAIYPSNGLFSAYIKLPPQNYTAGIVVTFYLTNGDKLPDDQHDEIDFEFLGHKDNDGWILQTNFYGNGSRYRGREEQYKLWFDPSKEAHKYTIFWAWNRIEYYIDDLLIREVQKVDAMGGDFPSKPMGLFATIWDGSGWATDSGKAKANFTYEPFVAEYSNFSVTKCWYNSNRKVSYCGERGHWMVCGKTTSDQWSKYQQFRNKYLTYSYCDDRIRYKTAFPECGVKQDTRSRQNDRELQKFQ